MPRKFVGNAHDNVINGTEGADRISGKGGNDTLNGLGGNDTISGGDGNDIINGGAGTNTLNGDAGNDTFKLTVEPFRDVVDGGAGTDTYDMSGYSAGVNLSLSGVVTQANNGHHLADSVTNVENWIGTDYSDNLQFGTISYSITAHGGGGSDILDGGLGDDRLYGDAGDDFVQETAYVASDDYLDGGDGNDTLYGSGGADTLVGGAGNDHFNYFVLSESPTNGADTIVDFVSGADVLDLTFVDDPNTSSTSDTWTLTTTPDGSAPQATITYDPNTGDSVLNLYSADGDTNADFTILLTDVNLQSSDVMW